MGKCGFTYSNATQLQRAVYTIIYTVESVVDIVLRCSTQLGAPPQVGQEPHRTPHAPQGPLALQRERSPGQRTERIWHLLDVA